MFDASDQKPLSTIQATTNGASRVPREKGPPKGIRATESKHAASQIRLVEPTYVDYAPARGESPP